MADIVQITREIDEKKFIKKLDGYLSNQ